MSGWNNFRDVKVKVEFHDTPDTKVVHLLAPKPSCFKEAKDNPVPKHVYLIMSDIHKQLFPGPSSITLATFRKALIHPTNKGFYKVVVDRELIEYHSICPQCC
jgi:hypothetical protein